MRLPWGRKSRAADSAAAAAAPKMMAAPAVKKPTYEELEAWNHKLQENFSKLQS